MRVLSSATNKIVITEHDLVDQIDVYLEDSGPGEGSAVVKCAGRSWTTSFNGMGQHRSIQDFLIGCSADYLMERFAPFIAPNTFNGPGLEMVLKEQIIARRRGSNGEVQDLSEPDARVLFDQAETVGRCGSLEECPQDVLRCINGPEFWFLPSEATKPNPEYDYVIRIILTVQEALKHLKEKAGVS